MSLTAGGFTNDCARTDSRTPANSRAPDRARAKRKRRHGLAVWRMALKSCALASIHKITRQRLLLLRILDRGLGCQANSPSDRRDWPGDALGRPGEDGCPKTLVSWLSRTKSFEGAKFRQRCLVDLFSARMYEAATLGSGGSMGLAPGCLFRPVIERIRTLQPDRVGRRYEKTPNSAPYRTSPAVPEREF